MLRSPMYGSSSLYDRVLSFLHGDGYEDRFRRIGERLPNDSWVLDVGCGTCHLADFLPPTMRYTGIDLNERFVADAKARGLDACIADVLDVEGYPKGPSAVIVSDMLHHIVPNERGFLGDLGREMRDDLLVCETLTQGSNPLQRVAGLLLDNDGFNDFRARLKFHLFDEFTRETLSALLSETIPAPAPWLDCRRNPGEARRGVRFFTLTAHWRC